MSPSSPPPSPATRRAMVWVAVTAIVIVAAIVTAVSVSRHHSSARGASTAKVAATLFVGAANSGSGNGAAAMSCTTFAAQARSLARSGADPGISFTLGLVTDNGQTATAVIDQAVDVGGTTQHQQYTLELRESSGLWLVCGQH